MKIIDIYISNITIKICFKGFYRIYIEVINLGKNIVITKNNSKNESIKVSKLPNGTYSVIYHPKQEKVEVKNAYYKAFESDDLK